MVLWRVFIMISHHRNACLPTIGKLIWTFRSQLTIRIGTLQNRMLNSPDHLFKKKSTRVGFLNFTGLLKRHKSSGQAAYHWANWVLHIQMVVHRALYLTIRCVVWILDVGSQNKAPFLRAKTFYVRFRFESFRAIIWVFRWTLKLPTRELFFMSVNKDWSDSRWAANFSFIV